MKCISAFFILLSFNLSAKSQSIFSALHLNEELVVRKGIPKQINNSTLFYNSNGTTESYKEQMEYDKFGLLVKKTRLNENDQVTTITTYKFDTINRVMLESRLNEINVRFPTKSIHTIYNYENSRSLIKIIEMDKEGIILAEILLKNDSSGHPVELLLFQPQGNLFGMEVATYLPNENKAIVSVANNRGVVLSTDTITLSFKDAPRFQNNNAQYNDNGDLISSQSIWPNGGVHYYEYEMEYDATGNWVKEKRYEVTYNAKGKKKRKLQAVFERTILYWTY